MTPTTPKPSPNGDLVARPANFLHHCRRCGYEVVLPQDDSRHSVCPKCPMTGKEGRFRVTLTDRPAIDETYGGEG